MGSIHLRRTKVIETAKAWAGPQGAAAASGQKTPIDVEELVRWAYREELPKIQRDPLRLGPADARGAGWAKMEEFLAELPLAGLTENRFGVVADPFARTGPHPDALAVHEAVCELEGRAIAVPDDWSHATDLGELGGLAGSVVARALDLLTVKDESGERRLRGSLKALVVHAALLEPPVWEIEPPQVDIERAKNGAPRWFVRRAVMVDGAFGPTSYEIEDDGYDRRRHVPKPGAYTKTHLKPDPTTDLVWRGEYELWHAALTMLAEDLADSLVVYAPTAPKRAARPWEALAAPMHVLADLTPARLSAVQARKEPSRSRASGLARAR